jgi:hypothetical protein
VLGTKGLIAALDRISRAVGLARGTGFLVARFALDVKAQRALFQEIVERPRKVFQAIRFLVLCPSLVYAWEVCLVLSALAPLGYHPGAAGNLQAPSTEDYPIYRDSFRVASSQGLLAGLWGAGIRRQKGILPPSETHRPNWTRNPCCGIV